MRGILRILVISAVAVVMTGTAYLAGFGTSWLMTHQMGITEATQAVGRSSQQAPSARPENFDVFWEAWDIIRSQFYGPVPDEREMTYGAIRGVLRELGDPNTLLIDPKAAELDRTQLEGEFEGIGAVVTMNEDGQLVVISPMEGQPAMEAGLQAGDIILKVDGQEITGMSLTDAVLLIRGPRGTTVRLTVLRPGTEGLLEFEIVRARIETPTVAHRILEESPDIGYIRLSLFGERSVDELKQAILDLQDQGAKAFILDIRNNPGGLLSSAIEVTSQFVSGEVIVTEKWNDGRQRPFRAQRGGLLTDPDVPLVVLVNKGSASASEILAGAIHDLHRGILVGEETFGKGSVQQVYTLSDKSQLNVTVAHWLTPNGDDINEQGILPDVVVTLTDEQIQAQEDVQLERAIEIAQKQLAGSS
ncbi:MAG: S41 family peptidase [Chloroflexi bacterium]|nr:MAG: S41 family peptidase [Chloroflexota bacterium]